MCSQRKITALTIQLGLDWHRNRIQIGQSIEPNDYDLQKQQYYLVH